MASAAAVRPFGVHSSGVSWCCFCFCFCGSAGSRWLNGDGGGQKAHTTVCCCHCTSHSLHHADAGYSRSCAAAAAAAPRERPQQWWLMLQSHRSKQESTWRQGRRCWHWNHDDGGDGFAFTVASPQGVLYNDEGTAFSLTLSFSVLQFRSAR